MATPQLRFKEFDGDWISTRLGNICSFTQGVQIPQSEQINYPKSGYIRYLYIRDFFTDKFPCYVRDVYPEKIIQPHEIMMVNTGNTTGEAYTGKCGVLSNNSFKIGYDLNLFDHKFMYLFCSSGLAQNQIKKFFNAGGQPHLGHKNVSLLEFSYPSKEEQTKIAAFLSAVDEKISQLTQKHELLSQYKQGMMQKLFSQQIRFKADDGSEFGEWNNLKIFDLAKDKILNNGVFNDQNKVGKGYKLINVLDMYINRDIDESRLKLLDLSEKEFEKNKVYYGDIFFTRSSLVKEGIAFSNVYLGNSNDVTYDGHLIKLSPDLDRVNPIFLNYVLKTSAVRKQLIKGGKTATMTTIGQQEVGNTIVSVPCLEEQTKIANFLSSLDQKIDVVAQQIQYAKQWKKGLLQHMFV